MSEKRHYCAYCGADMGDWTSDSRRGDTCGERECKRAARDDEQQAREEAHEQLDRDLGYGRF